MDPISDYAAFVAVAEAGGFSAAAKRMGVTTAGVSKAVLRLEDRLGVRLFTRTTRRVRLTADGERFLPSARAILADVDAAEADLREGAARLEGRVRVEMPVVYGTEVIAPRLGALHLAHAGLAVELRLSDEVHDPIETGADVAIRFGTAVPDGMIRRRLRATRWWTVAAPGYLDAHGGPVRPEDLHHHRTIAYVYRSTGRAHRWRFRGGAMFDPPPGLSVDDGFAHRRLALDGVGLAQDVDAVLEADVMAGRLVRVLVDRETDGLEIGLVYPSRRLVPARVRAVIEAIVGVG